MAFPIADVIAGIFGPLLQVLDKAVLTDEEKLTFKQKLFESQLAMYEKVLDYEARVADAQSKIITAEASSEGWLTKSWRPLLMVVFGGLVVARWFGFSAPNIPVEIEAQLWTILQIGIGGYVGGRSLEKIATVVGDVMTKRNEG